MRTRIITAVVAIAILLPVLYFSDTIVFPLLILACALIAVGEMAKCTGVFPKWVLTAPLYLLTGFVLLPFWFAAEDICRYAVLAVGILLLYDFAVMTFSHGKISLNDISVSFLTGVYIVAAFTALTLLRYRESDGKYLYLICFIGAWVVDTFAYFTGYFFGKHKLIPDVSPKKTVEGSIGGTVAVVGAMVLYGYIVGVHSKGMVVPNYLVLALSGLVISAVSQLGDLLMSAVKRVYGIKDYGKLFPGHGGVLDRFDSVMAVALLLALISSRFDLFSILG